MDWRAHIPFNEALAFLLALLTVVVPLYVYRDYPSLLGPFPRTTVIATATLGAAASCALYVVAEELWLALLPGFVTGASAAALYVAYVDTRWSSQWDYAVLVGALTIGAILGLALMWGLRRLVYRSGPKNLDSPLSVISARGGDGIARMDGDDDGKKAEKE